MICFVHMPLYIALQHLVNAVCEVLAAPSLAELFWESVSACVCVCGKVPLSIGFLFVHFFVLISGLWKLFKTCIWMCFIYWLSQNDAVNGIYSLCGSLKLWKALLKPSYSWLQKPNMGLGMILDSAVGVFPHKPRPLLQLLTALLSDKPTAKKVFTTHTDTQTHSLHTKTWVASLCFLYLQFHRIRMDMHMLHHIFRMQGFANMPWCALLFFDLLITYTHIAFKLMLPISAVPQNIHHLLRKIAFLYPEKCSGRQTYYNLP